MYVGTVIPNNNHRQLRENPKLMFLGCGRTSKVHIQRKDPESKPKPSSDDSPAAKTFFFLSFYFFIHVSILNCYISILSCVAFLRFLGSFGSQNSSKQSNNGLGER